MIRISTCRNVKKRWPNSLWQRKIASVIAAKRYVFSANACGSSPSNGRGAEKHDNTKNTKIKIIRFQ